MTAFSESLARGIVKHRRRFADQRSKKGNYRGFLVELERDGFLIETYRRPPRPGVPSGLDVLHFDWSVGCEPGAPENYVPLPGIDVWVTSVDKRGRMVPQHQGCVLSIKTHALERYIYRTGTTDQKRMLDEFKPPMPAFAALSLMERTALLEGRFLVTATGSGPLAEDDTAKTYDPVTGFVFPVPALVTWIPDALTREENAERLARVQAARAAREWWVRA